LNINVPNINFTCINAQLKNCCRKATATSVNDNLYIYRCDSNLWLQHENKMLFHVIKYKLLSMDRSEHSSYLYIDICKCTIVSVDIMCIDIIKVDTYED
jgi:hypothetical protein